MRKLVALGALVLLSFAASDARAVTIDITLAPQEVSTLGEVTFIIGVLDDAGGLVNINAYTLDYLFDSTELMFVSAMQLADFGGNGPPDPFIINDCTTGRCTAGLTPGVDANGVGDLFSLTFNVIEIIDDGVEDLRVGILDSVFDGISQPIGDPIFDNGEVIQDAFVTPEPSTGLLMAFGLGGLAMMGRRGRRIR